MAVNSANAPRIIAKNMTRALATGSRRSHLSLSNVLKHGDRAGEEEALFEILKTNARRAQGDNRGIPPSNFGGSNTGEDLGEGYGNLENYTM